VAGVQGQSLAEPIEKRLARELESSRPPAALAPFGERIGSAWPLTRRFYTQRGGRPAWVSVTGPDRRLRDLLDALEQAEAQGLDTADYPIHLLRALLGGSVREPDSLALLDVVATAAFFQFGTDLTLGRVAPASVDSMWAAAPRTLDLIGQLATALEAGRVDSTLQALAPSQAGAVRLRAALAHYRDLEARAGWDSVSAGPSLVLGAEGARVAALRRRLAVTGDLASASGDVFDATVLDAVERIQARHGLEMDGIVGPATLAALNVPVAERIRQLELNLERWRWLPPVLGERYIAVNSAAFTLEVVEAGCTILVAPVVAGRVDWPTPIASGMLTDVVFNPRWNIPRSIAVQDVLPVVRRDPGFLARESIHVMSDATEQAVELDPSEIRWDTVVDTTFTYRLWQDPGPKNPLGRIRFGVSNRFGVALHDTPNQESFNLRNRVFSHGCVRVAGAQELAAYVLERTPEWGQNSADSVLAAVTRPGERRLAAPQAIPVYLNYWTAWVDEDGIIEFRPDVYGWDVELAAALRDMSRGRSSPTTPSLGY